MKEFNFSKKRKAQLYTIITTLLLCVSACAFSNFDTYASESVTNFNLLSVYNISDYVMPYDSTDNFEKFGSYPDSSTAEWYLKMLDKGEWNVTGNIQNTTDYPYFFVASYTRKPVNNQVTTVKFFQLPESAFVLFLNQGYYVMVPNCPSDYRSIELEMIDEGTPSFLEFENDRRGDTKYFGETPYQAFYVAGYSSSSIAPVINADVPYYYMDVDYLVDVPTHNETFDSSDNGNNSTDLGGGGTNDGDATNNLYFKDCDISYSCTGNTNGNIVCQAKLNDYQKEHADEFLVVYNFTFDVKGYRVNDIGENLGDKLEFTKNYSYQQTLSDFYNNSSSKVFTLKDIEQNINTTDITADGWGDGWPGSEYGNLYQLFNYMNNNLSSSGDLTEGKPFKYIKCSVKTTMFVTIADVSLDNLTSGNSRSGSYSETYNFVKGTSSLNSDGILNNSNPVETNSSGSIDSNEDLASLTTQGGVSGNDMPSSNNGNGSGSGSGSVSGDNNIVINNNPTFNNNSNGSGSNGSLSTSGGSPSNSGLFSTLVDFVKGDTESTSESISELVDSDGWISVINSYYTFIPEKFWTLLFTVMGTCIGIMVVGFIISIVLRFIS